MQLGPITVRWTKDIEAEQADRNRKKKISLALTQALMDDNRRLKAEYKRWGIDEHLIKQRQA